MRESEDFYFLTFEHRPLTPEQWEQVKRGVRRQAHADRARIVRDLLAGVPTLLLVVARGGRAMGRMLARSAGKWSSAYATWRERRMAVKELGGLDDRALKDIGLHRSEIELVVYGPDSSRVTEGKVAAFLFHKPVARRSIATKGATKQLIEKSAA
jgi:uncharacterized protein YjiS (DUF1127 family)